MSTILHWLANGRTGSSSKTMAFTALGTPAPISYPHDPDDLNRCILLVEQCPEVREAFPAIRELSSEWAQIIDNWDELVALFHIEAGPDWSRAHSAPVTYDKMKQLFMTAKREAR